MAYTTPSTQIDLMRVATDPSYRNVRYFQTLQDQYDYFTAKTISTHSSITYQNYSSGKLRLQVSAETVKNCNYIRIRNVSYENKAYYAFLTSYEVISDNCVELQFKIDYFQTYFFDYITPSCYIERTHTNTDNVGDNIEKEPLSVELKTLKEGTHVNYYDLSQNIVMVNTPATWNPQNLRILNNQIIVADVTLFDLSVQSSRDLFLAVIQDLNYQGALDRILFMKSIPDWAYSTTNTTNTPYLPSHNVIHTVDATVFQPSHSGGSTYTPRNYKLYTSQFTKIRIMDSNGSTLDLRPECFDNPGKITEINVTETCNLIGDVVVMVKLNNYSDNTRENRIYIGGFPDVILTRDRWNEYLSQNGASVGLNLIRSALSANSIAGSIGSLSPLATMADIKRQPSSVLGSPGVSYPVASAELGWASYKLQVPAEEAQRIDEYFDIYGYSVNTVDIPSRKVRDRFTYVKTKELRVRGNNMPEDAITVISEAYNNGVTFWADNDNFMNYSIVIREANSLHNI